MASISQQEEQFKVAEKAGLPGVAEEKAHASDNISVEIERSNQAVTPSVTPSYNIDTSNFEMAAPKNLQTTKKPVKQQPQPKLA